MKYKLITIILLLHILINLSFSQNTVSIPIQQITTINTQNRYITYLYSGDVTKFKGIPTELLENRDFVIKYRKFSETDTVFLLIGNSFLKKITIIDVNKNNNFSDDFVYFFDKRNYKDEKVEFPSQKIEINSNSVNSGFYFAPNDHDRYNVIFKSNNEMEHQYYVTLDLYEYYSGKINVGNKNFKILIMIDNVNPFSYKYTITENLNDDFTSLKINNNFTPSNHNTIIDNKNLMPIGLTQGKDSIYLSIKQNTEKMIGYYKEFYLPEIKINDFYGQELDFIKLSKDYLLIDFWGSWCGSCIENFPEIINIRKRHNNLSIVSIAKEYDEKGMEKAKGIIKRYKMNWFHIIEKSKKENISSKFNINVFPTLILVNPEGKIIFRNEGGNLQEISKVLDEKLFEH